MAMVLKIENETSLPDGGPLSVAVQGMRGIDIGRDRHLDWTLPDPTRTISGKHCEIRYQDDGYMLFDVSTNGTFLDGSHGRLKGPHKLRNGDRLIIGHYIISVTIDGEPAPDARVVQPTSYDDLWNASSDAAPPVDRAKLRTPREQPKPRHADFLNWAADMPDAPSGGSVVASAPFRKPAVTDDMTWASGPARPAPVPEPPPAVPAPRRPVSTAADLGEPWASPEAVARDEPLEPLSTPRQGARADNAFVAPARASGAGDFRSRVAQGAGILEASLTHKSEDELAEELGALMQFVAENVRQLLKARLQTKGIVRSVNQTTIQALDNNPLKFSATTKDALEIMFGPPTKSYLDARRAFEQGFKDIKSHQLRTFTAMQQALATLISDLDPTAIDKATDQDAGISKLIVSRKAKLWDAYVSRWQAKTRHFDGGLLDAFMDYFAQCYDKDNEL
jgi:type VI secretion system protein ImpI